MSDLRIGLVVEGTTDFIVLEAALTAILRDHTLIFTRLQPSGDETFGSVSRVGWGGVLEWCLQNTTDLQERLLKDLDLVVLNVDADVAEKQYSDVFGRQQAPFDNLPCDKPCPPASDTVDALRAVVLSWVGGRICSNWVLCIPSKCMEAWLVPILLEDQPAALAGLECNRQVEEILIRHKNPKLLKRKDQRLRKITKAYRDVSPLITERWRRITEHCEQASHFETLVKGMLAD